jgi:hypothetical protein
LERSIETYNAQDKIASLDDILRETYPKKHHLGPQNGPGSSGPKKTAKNSKLPKLPETCFGPVGEGGWPPISTWINPPSLGSNGLHCVEFLGERGKRLLNLNLGDLLALLEKWRCLAC